MIQRVSINTTENLQGKIYRAIVASVNDPKQLGRIRIRIPVFHGYKGDRAIPTRSLPWALPALNRTWGVGGGQNIIPKVNEIVWVVSEGDVDKWVYLGVMPQGKMTLQVDGELPSDSLVSRFIYTTDGLKYDMVYKTADTEVMVNKSTGDIFIGDIDKESGIVVSEGISYQIVGQYKRCL